jgi:hypothetical protein
MARCLKAATPRRLKPRLAIRIASAKLCFIQTFDCSAPINMKTSLAAHRSPAPGAFTLSKGMIILALVVMPWQLRAQDKPTKDVNPKPDKAPTESTGDTKKDRSSSGNKVENTNATPIIKTFEAAEGKYRFSLDTTVAPDLTEWADTQLRPVVQEWYPKLVTLLPSDGFVARTNVTIRFREDMGRTPASAGGGNINCNAGWFRKELKREAVGSVVHEMVHVVQSYGRGRRDDPNYVRMPGWLVEGIPDYIRWFLYEPQTKGAEITARNLERAKFDSSYRISGNFLDWVVRTHDTNIIQKLNAAGRAGKYRPELWKEATGRSVEELGEAWKAFHTQRLAAATTNSNAKPILPDANPTPAPNPKTSGGASR